ncbi:MAG: aminotransferase class V-fold PLP-dependent enzyme [Planctomycetales bacterium]|nr:aminotransferase class V-fold PLP-dependent enzyme [Planctomycetales bacterium]
MPLAEHWTLEPGVDFLNHGSFGACPRPVLEEQERLRRRLESQPVRFFMREMEGLLAEARATLAAFVGADPEDLAFVRNATTAVNAVVRSLPWRGDDEILTTDQAYNACRNTLDSTGARVVTAALPFPVSSPDDLAGPILERVTKRTRLALLDHVTSPTALVLPLERLVRDLSARGVDALVDGAHAPGMIPLDLGGLGAAYYTGNCHKWLCAPKGAAFLHVRRDRRDRVRPAVISHGANAELRGRPRFRVEFDWTGTDDPTPALCVPAAIRFLGTLFPGGIPALQRRNHDLAIEGRSILCDALGVPPPAPPEMLGSMASVPIRDATSPPPSSPFGTESLQDDLWTRHRIEVPVMGWPAWPRRLIRISAQAYNTVDQYRRLAAALRERLR